MVKKNLFLLLIVFFCGSVYGKAFITQTDSVQNECQDDEVAIKMLKNKNSDLTAFLAKHQLHIDTCDNRELYEMIKRWYRTPYRWGGTTHKGVDCQGFVLVVNDTLFNRTLPRGAGAQYYVSQPIKKAELQEGDLVFFKIGTSAISHVGLYLKNGKFVHASSGYGVIISDLNEPYYKRWFFSGGRVINEKVTALSQPTKNKIGNKS